MFVSARPDGAPSLELRRDDQDTADDGDQPDVQERLHRDLVRTHDEPQRVEQLPDDQRKQHAIEHEHRDVDCARSSMELTDETDTVPASTRMPAAASRRPTNA